jgi:hypothetical protein
VLEAAEESTDKFVANEQRLDVCVLNPRFRVRAKRGRVRSDGSYATGNVGRAEIYDKNVATEANRPPDVT